MSEKPSFQAPIGTRDVLAPESARWTAAIATFAGIAEQHGYGLAVGPLFEDLAVFERLGASTDVVTKEMYDFFDKSDPPRHLALRPEGTASVARAFIQQRPLTPFKAWYLTPAFRYEKPQAGRLRQHHQLGIEAMGAADPELDVEVLSLASSYLGALGLSQVRLAVNSMGTTDDRARYGTTLRTWLTEHRGDLDPSDADKIDTNPLRVLDSKRRATRQVIGAAPKLIDDLSDEAAAHFEAVRGGLRSLGIDHDVEPRLVRGLDYYVHTTFEFQSSALDAAQNTIIGGGRYDGLVELLGGPPTPGIGFGSGIERVLLACDAEGAFDAPTSTLDVFVVDVAGGQANSLATELRTAGLRVDRAFDGRSMKAQMKVAGRSSAAVAVIVGDDEVADGTVTIRDLRTGKGQETVARSVMLSTIGSILEDQ
ncbi:MAG TPA: histidine--tRNA ligase [Acidimicrobiales bacterium]|nr:histidine--tRNA ligase [Acidimicrobiales bacterium]